MDEIIHLSSFSRPAARGAGWSISRKEIIAAPPERVWRALTEPAELVRWWCDFAEVEPRAGGRYAFGGAHVYGAAPGPADRSAMAEEGEIASFVPASRLELRWRLHSIPTLVAYGLENYLESTELTVTQTAERAPGWDPGAGPSWWSVALPALRALVERGQPDLRIDYAAPSTGEEIAFEVGVTTFPWIIWHKLTNAAELDRWWARGADVEASPGGSFRLGGELPGPRSVLEVEEGRRLVHDWIWPDGASGRVEWLLRETDDDVRVSVRDLGPRSAGIPREGHLIYWASTLLSLKQMSERGIGPREYQDA